MKTVGRITLCLIVCLTTEVSAGFFSNLFDPEWDTLRITFGLNLFSPWVFAKMPLKRSKAESENFVQIGGKDAPCGGKFFGYRYIKNDDPAVILMYDVNGYFAGIQTSFPEQTIEKTESLNWFKKSPMFTVEELTLNGNQSKSYTLTAYLVDPTIICSTGRTQQEFDDSKGGTNLYFKNGTQDVAVPKQQTNLTETSWTLGKCFPSMGVHYWYNTTKDMNCDYFQPVFLMYNHGKLTGFGWAVVGDFSSKRYEHPPKSSFSKFFKEIPDCFLSLYDQVGGFSTQHVYMNAMPWNLMC